MPDHLEPDHRRELYQVSREERDRLRKAYRKKVYGEGPPSVLEWALIGGIALMCCLIVYLVYCFASAP